MLGIDCSYTAVDVPEDRLADLLQLVRTDHAWRGLSVTMPLKAAAAHAVDTVTSPASALGVVNTVVVGRGGSTGAHLTGHNTDVVGVARALAGAGVTTPEYPVVLGGGGTAAAAVAGLAELGATTVHVLVRRPAAASDLTRIGGALGVDVQVLEWPHAVRALQRADVVVSTLPPRAADPLADTLAGAGNGPTTTGVLLDVAYDPWPSALAACWQAAGGRIVPGLDMLLHQAVEQVLLFFPEAGGERQGILDVMCDAVGVPRR